MICEICGIGAREERLIRYSLSIDDGLVVVDHVPAQVCSQCGEITLRPEVVDALQKTIWRKRKPNRMIETPVYEFAS